MNPSRQDSITQLLTLIKLTGLNWPDLVDFLQTTYNLYICEHPTQPIAILSYGQYHKNKQLMTNVCRGLILEHSENQIKVISRGFDRFFPINLENNHTISVNRATIKEDGSLMYVFKYQNNWHLSTLHNFAQANLPNKSQTYADLFLEIINQPLNDFVNHLINQINDGDQIMTFCFEMCSIYNQVIKRYDTPTLFLLAIFGDSTGSTEYQLSADLQLPPNVQLIRTIELPQITNRSEILSQIQILSQNDITFEGVVIQTSENERLKIKNPYYYIHHRLKYRGWITATPQLIIPLILNQTSDLIISNVIQAVNYDLITIRELNLRYNYYRHKIKVFHQQVNQILQSLPNQTEIMTFKRQHYQLFKLLTKINCNTHRDRQKIETIINQYINNKIELIASEFTLNFDPTHPIYCYHSLPTFMDHNDGLAINSQMCYCGQKMELIRLNRDVLRYRVCHCRVKFGILKYASGTQLLVCSNHDCECTHEVNQLTGQALGIPASIQCKNLRLAIHDLITNRIQSNSWTRQQCYQQIAEITNKSIEQAHMAQMGITDCIQVINAFTSKN